MTAPLAGILALCCFAANAQDASQDVAAPSPGKPSWQFTPSIAVDGTYTDNVNPGAARRSSDFITQVSPGVRLEGAGSRVSGNLDYRWQHYSYADNSARNSQQRSMAADGKVELVERWLFLEGRNNISQRSVSTFGTQSAGNELVNSNRTETSSWQLSPHIQGHFGSAAEYQARFSESRSKADAGALSGSGSATSTWTGRLAGGTGFSVAGWSLDGQRNRLHTAGRDDTQSARLVAALELRLDPQFRVSLRGGRETDNYSSADTRRRGTSGFGLDWAPSERTQVKLNKDRHSYGNSFGIDFSHRTALSAWKFSDSRDVRLPVPQLVQAPVGSALGLLEMQLTSTVPDAAARSKQARSTLEAAGIPFDSPVLGSLLTSQAFVERRQEASLALLGANNTVTFSVNRNNSEKIGSGVGIADDFALSSRIRQSGFATSWAHKLSPESALTLNATRSNSSGETAALESRLTSWTALLTTKLGMRTTGSLGLRKTNTYRAAGSGYDEHALTGSLMMSF